MDIEKIHKIVLDIYKVFREICKENGLRYFAISGTTIGAVLWGNIIPWDDDIDIAMPAEDYKKFVKLCKKNVLPKYLSFNEYAWFGGKLHDNRTMFTNVYYLNKPEKYNGVSIDVVPLINLPDDELERDAFVKDLEELHWTGMLFDRYNVPKEMNTKKIKEWQSKILNSYSFGQTRYVMDFSDPRYVLSAKGFENPQIFKFADVDIPVSSNYDEDLTTQYGKYEKNPPEHVKKSYHQELSFINLDNSCEYYKKIFDRTLPDVRKFLDIKQFYEGVMMEDFIAKEKMIAVLQKQNLDLNKKIEEIMNGSSRFFRIRRKVKKILRINNGK